MNQDITFIDDLQYANFTKLKKRQTKRNKTQLSNKDLLGLKLDESRTNKISLVGIDLLNTQPKSTPPSTITGVAGLTVGNVGGGSSSGIVVAPPFDPRNVMQGQFVPTGGGAVGGGGGAVSEEGGVEAPKQNKKTNYILLGLGGLALIYFLFLRKRN